MGVKNSVIRAYLQITKSQTKKSTFAQYLKKKRYKSNLDY